MLKVVKTTYPIEVGRRDSGPEVALPGYLGNSQSMPSQGPVVERAQTGVRMEKRILKVLKGLAEYFDMTLGDLLEGIVLHAFEGKAPPFGAEQLRVIEDLKRVYGLDLDATAAHRLVERDGAGA
jgi:hypothetical protein